MVQATQKKRAVKRPIPEDFSPVPTWPKGHYNYGKVGVRCHGYVPSKNGQCEQFAMLGAKHCFNHGGAMEIVRGVREREKHQLEERKAKNKTTRLRDLMTIQDGKIVPLAEIVDIEELEKRTLRKAASGSPIRGYSRYLGGSLQERFLEALDDPENLSLAPEIALVDLRIGLLAEQIGRGPSEGYLQEIDEAVSYLEDSFVSGANVTQAIGRLRRVLQEARDERRDWEEIIGLAESRRKLVASDRQRLMDGEQLIAIHTLIALIAQSAAAFRSAVKEEVSDVELAFRIVSKAQANINGLISQ